MLNQSFEDISYIKGMMGISAGWGFFPQAILAPLFISMSVIFV